MISGERERERERNLWIKMKERISSNYDVSHNGGVTPYIS